MILQCFHRFHEECVTTWFQRKNTCPICKRRVDEDESGNNSNNLEPVEMIQHEPIALARNFTSMMIDLFGGEVSNNNNSGFRDRSNRQLFSSMFAQQIEEDEEQKNESDSASEH